MLDLHIRLKDNGTISVSPHRKETCQKLWLGSDSCHPSNVHAYWPGQMVKRLTAINDKGPGQEAAAHFVSELRDQHPDHLYLKKVHSHTAHAPRATIDRSWLVMKFSRLWTGSGINRVMRDIAVASGVTELSWYKLPTVCWSKAEKHMFTKMNKRRL